MKEFDSPGLRELHRVLEMSKGPPQFVDYQDELVQQAVGLNPFLRRALAPGIGGGIFTASMLNTHVGSDTIVTDVNPHTPGTTFVGDEYPDPVPDNLDVWLLAAHSINVTAPGDFGGGSLSLLTDALGMGWRNEANAIAVNSLVEIYTQELAVGNAVMLTGGGSDDFTQLDIHRRITPNTLIRFETVKSGVGAGSYKCFLWLGLFPAGMGQDGV